MTTLSTLELVGNPDKASVISADSLQLHIQSLTEKLLSSEIYQNILTSLQDKLGTVTATVIEIETVIAEVQTILQQLGQEAIRLTLQQSIAPTHPPTHPPTETPTANSASTKFMVITAAPVDAASPAKATLDGYQQVTAKPLVQTAATATTTTETTTPERDRILQAIGQQFLQARQAQGITLSQLYSKTFVPMHHLKSLEAGQIAKLPEDVFLRGFVQRIANALGLDGGAIAAQIPIPVAAKRVVPTWHNSLVAKPLFTPAHLYVGYAVLMAGAVSGLALMNQPREIVNEYPDIIPHEPNAQPDKDVSQGAQLDRQQSGSTTSAVSANIAPPEMF